MCASLSPSCYLGWVGLGGGVVLLGDDGIKPTDNQEAGCLKKFQCSDLFIYFFYKLYNTNISLALQQNYFYNKVMFFH